MRLGEHQRLAGLLIALIGLGFLLWAWKDAEQGEHASATWGMICVIITVMGLGVTIFPLEAPEEIQTLRQLPGKWKVIVLIAIGAGLVNYHLLSRSNGSVDESAKAAPEPLTQKTAETESDVSERPPAPEHRSDSLVILGGVIMLLASPVALVGLVWANAASPLNFLLGWDFKEEIGRRVLFISLATIVVGIGIAALGW
jgi:hypothetical protein